MKSKKVGGDKSDVKNGGIIRFFLIHISSDHLISEYHKILLSSYICSSFDFKYTIFLASTFMFRNEITDFSHISVKFQKLMSQEKQ